MHDYESAAWAEHHAQASNAIRSFLHAIRFAFERLQARRYDAPWRTPQRRSAALRH